MYNYTYIAILHNIWYIATFLLSNEIYICICLVKKYINVTELHSEMISEIHTYFMNDKTKTRGIKYEARNPHPEKDEKQEFPPL